MVFSGESPQDIINMCKVLGYMIRNIVTEYKVLGNKARFFMIGIKEAMNARAGSAEVVAYSFKLSSIFFMTKK